MLIFLEKSIFRSNKNEFRNQLKLMKKKIILKGNQGSIKPLKAENYMTTKKPSPSLSPSPPMYYWSIINNI